MKNKQNPYLEYPLRENFIIPDDDRPMAEITEYRAAFFLFVEAGARLLLVPMIRTAYREFGRCEYSLSGEDGPWLPIDDRAHAIPVDDDGDLVILVRGIPSEASRQAGRWPQFGIAAINIDGPQWHRDLADMDSIMAALEINFAVEKSAYGLYRNGKFRGVKMDAFPLSTPGAHPGTDNTQVMFRFTPGQKTVTARYDGPLGSWIVSVSPKTLMPKSWPFPTEGSESSSYLVS